MIVNHETIFKPGHTLLFKLMLQQLEREKGESHAEAEIAMLTDDIGEVVDGKSTGLAAIALSMILLQVLEHLHRDNPEMEQLLEDFHKSFQSSYH